MELDDELRKYAVTRRQQETFDAVKQYGSQRKAAEATGIPSGTISKRMQALNRAAARQGYSPQHDMLHPVPEGFFTKGVSTYYNKDGVPTGQWVKSQIDQEKQFEFFKAAVESMTEELIGLAPITPAPRHCEESLMCTYVMGDPHFGMHAWWEEAGENFNLKEAERVTCAAIDRLVATAPKAKTALMLNLGDVLHADNQSNLSQSGHQLDVDGRWTKVMQTCLRAMIHCVRRLLEKHEKVVVRINRGNHDGHSSFALAMMLSCFFHDEPRIQVDLSPAAAWYYRFGQVLIGSTHGDTMKGKDLPLVMATDRHKDWGETMHRYWYVGHVHHSDLKEYQGCVVEYFRTLAARDAWHAGQGYRAGRDMRLIVLHQEHGECERHRCDIGHLKNLP